MQDTILKFENTMIRLSSIEAMVRCTGMPAIEFYLRGREKPLAVRWTTESGRDSAAAEIEAIWQGVK